MRRVLIRNAAVATMDPDLGDLPRADVLVERDTIAAVGPDLEVGDVSEDIDASQMIALPGLVDAHRHTWRTALRGVAVDRAAPERLLTPHYRPDDVYAGTYLGALECLDSGVTTVVDHGSDVASVAHARAAVAGLRAAGVRGIHALGASRTSPGDRTHPARELRAEHLADPGDLLRLGIAVAASGGAPVEDLTRGFALARELDARIVLHGPDVLSTAHRLGLLGDDVLAAHATPVRDGQWAVLDGTGTTVAVAAGPDASPTGVMTALRAATEHTPGPALGSDGISGSAVDMICQARLALQATRWWSVDGGSVGAPPWTPRDALRWATLNGARAAGLDDLVGSLTPGKRADIVLIDMSGVGRFGWDRRDPCGAVIDGAHPGLVDTVLLDGRMVKRRGQLCGVDTDRARGLLAESQDHLEAELAAQRGRAQRGRAQRGR